MILDALTHRRILVPLGLAAGVVLAGTLIISSQPDREDGFTVPEGRKLRQAISTARPEGGLEEVPVSAYEREDIREARLWLDEALAVLDEAPIRHEACRIVLAWMDEDRESAMRWLSGLAADSRRDILRSTAVLSLISTGRFDEAQDIADRIIDPAIQEWAHAEAWSRAYELKTVTKDDLRESGLPDRLVESIVSRPSGH